MAKSNWYQRLEEAKRTLEHLARAAQDGSAHRKGSTNFRVASRHNVKVVGNFGKPNSTQAAVAQQVTPIRQEHRSGTPEEGSTRGIREGGDAGHETGRA